MKVIVHGRETPVILEDRGPEITEREINEFEARLGHELPSDYRDFLLHYNGGSPKVGDVNGRDDNPEIPYQHGDAIRTFLKLPASNARVNDYEKLRAPAEISWGLPKQIFPIAEDGGGNLFVMELGRKNNCIRFLDHESLDEPLSQHRIIADNFLDLLLRFRTIEEQEAIDKAEHAEELKTLKTGKFPRMLESQCRPAEKTFPEIRRWIRALCLNILKQKGYFAIHDDPNSRLLLDIAFWLHQNVKAPGATTKRTEVATIVTRWFPEARGEFGLAGYAPGFLLSWWEDRLAKKMLKGTAAAARFKDDAAAKMFQELRKLSQDEI